MKIALLIFFAACGCLPAPGKDATSITEIRYGRMWNYSKQTSPHPADSASLGDIRSWLKAKGVTFSAGDEVIVPSPGYLIVRAKKMETLDAVGKTLNFEPPLPAIANLRVDLTLAEFPAEKLPECEGEIPYATLRKAAGSSWQVLDQMVVTTQSAQRTTATLRSKAPTKKPATPDPSQDHPPSSNEIAPLPAGVVGANLEVEPTLEENGKAIDVNIDYHYRGADAHAWDSKAGLSITVRDGVPMIAQLDSKPSDDGHPQSAKLRALIVRVDVVDPKGTAAHTIQQSASSPTSPTAPDLPATQGLPFKMWFVPPHTFAGSGVNPLSPEDHDGWDLRAWFAGHGIRLATGEEAFYDRFSTTLVVCARTSTLDLVDQLGFRGWTSYLPSNLRLEAVLVEFSAANLPELGGEIPIETLRKAAGTSWHVINRMLITSKSGQRVVTESTGANSEAKPALTKTENDPPPETNGDDFLERNQIGASLEIEPVVLQDDDGIAVNTVYQDPVAGHSHLEVEMHSFDSRPRWRPDRHPTGLRSEPANETASADPTRRCRLSCGQGAHPSIDAMASAVDSLRGGKKSFPSTDRQSENICAGRIGRGPATNAEPDTRIRTIAKGPFAWGNISRNPRIGRPEPGATHSQAERLKPLAFADTIPNQAREKEFGKSQSQPPGDSQQPCEPKTIQHMTMNPSRETPAPRFGAKIIPLLEQRRIIPPPEDEAARLQEIGSQAAKIAHDLNNLLAPILMSLEVFRPHLDDSSHLLMLELAKKSTLRAADLVKQILTFARGGHEERRQIDPAEVVQEIEAFARATFPRRLNIEVSAPENLSPITGSATQLHRALLNLCVNARDAMSEGGTLTLRAANVTFDASNIRLPRGARHGHYVLFEVGDTGSGIPAAIREKIFDPFFTTKGAGKGTGLGLASVRSIVESHAGLLSLQTEPGKGTTFQILIPVSKSARPSRPVTGEIRIVAA